VLAAIKPWRRGLPLPATRAREFAQSVNAEILLVSVVFDPLIGRGLVGAEVLETVSEERLMEQQRVELESIAQSLRDWGASVAVRVIWDAAPHRGIVRAAEEWQADLIVVGAHEGRSPLHTPLTDTHWRLMQTSVCPLWLAKDSAPKHGRTILAAVDPSRAESSAVDRRVLSAARELAAALDCRLRAVHAFSDPESFALVSAVEVSPGVFYGAENVAELHRHGVEELAAAYGIDADRTDVRPGAPAAVIAEVMAEHEVRLVVLGLSRRGPLEQIVFGSVTQAVTQESVCDVLLIPGARERGRDTR
jgi:nucleotide-binding universal stress UspA family protein